MIPLEPDKFYHIYNRANGNERIFLNKANYEFFFRSINSTLNLLQRLFVIA